MEPPLDPIVIVAGVLLVMFFLILLVAAIWQKLARFCEELREINMEIRRASPKERGYWLRRRRRHWLSLLPFR